MDITSKIRAIAVFAVAIVLSFTMAFAPGITKSTYAAASDDMTYEDFEGQSLESLEKDSDTESLAEDPELYRYYEVDSKGKLREKEVELDEVDKFIQEMDKNAEGISDDTIAEMNDNMNSVGCGVSGLGKAEIPSKYKSFKRYNCLDISWWQGDISAASWKKVKAAGVTHVIIRTGYTSLKSFSLNMDSKFGNNINRAYDAGLKVGVYHFSQATTVSEAEKEAAYTLKLIENYKSKIKLPVVFDFETNAAGRLNMSKLKKLAKDGTSTKICQAFCDKVKAGGFTPMIYANYTMLNNYMDNKTLAKKNRIWLANYTTKGTATTYPGEYWMWQYSSSGKVNGLSGSVDMNYIFDNGQGGSSVSTSSSSTDSTTVDSDSSDSTTDDVDSGTYRARVTTSLNYRTGPGTTYKKKGTFKKGTVVKVVGKSGKWALLSNGYYVNSAFLNKVNSSAVSAYKVKTKRSLNYRTGPGTNYTKKGTYKKGKVLTIYGKKGSWGRTSTGYYILLKYTKKL